MTSGIIAQVLEEVMYVGHVQTGSKRLVYEDFLQLVYLANASILSDRFRQDQLLGQDLGLGELINPYELEVKEDKYKRKVSDLPVDVIQLPGSAGIFSITPLAADGSLVQCRPIIRMPAGSEWLYCNDQDGPFSYFTNYKKQIVYYLLDDCVKKVLANIIASSEDSLIPDDIGWQVFKQVYAQIVRTYSIPVDKRMDGNPNLEEIFMTKLTSPQTVR